MYLSINFVIDFHVGKRTINYESSGSSTTTMPFNSNYSNTYFYKIMDAPTSRFKIVGSKFLSWNLFRTYLANDFFF